MSVIHGCDDTIARLRAGRGELSPGAFGPLSFDEEGGMRGALRLYDVLYDI